MKHTTPALISLLLLVTCTLFPVSVNAVMTTPTWFWQRRSIQTIPPKPVANRVMPLPISTPRPIVLPTPSPTIKPTSTPNPTPTVTSMPIPTAIPNQNSGTSVRDYLIAKVNEYRKSQGLSEVTTDPYTCNFAKLRAQEISTAFNHDGFNNRIATKSLPYPTYTRVTENIAMTNDYSKVTDLWINSPGHASNMRLDTPHVCVEQYGNYYAYEGWKP